MAKYMAIVAQKGGKSKLMAERGKEEDSSSSEEDNKPTGGFTRQDVSDRIDHRKDVDDPPRKRIEGDRKSHEIKDREHHHGTYNKGGSRDRERQHEDKKDQGSRRESPGRDKYRQLHSRNSRGDISDRISHHCSDRREEHKSTASCDKDISHFSQNGDKHPHRRPRHDSTSDSDSSPQKEKDCVNRKRSKTADDHTRKSHQTKGMSHGKHSGSDSCSDKEELPKRYGLIIKQGSESRVPAQPRQTAQHKPAAPAVRPKSPPRQKLSAEEKERRRQEMKEAAVERDAQRRTNVKRYRAEDEHEERERRRNLQQDEGAGFLAPLLSSHAAQSSVEDRLKRNRHHVDRSVSK